MGSIRAPIPVKLFTGLLAADPALIDLCSDDLKTAFGEIDFKSEVVPWNASRYYEDEMGPSLLRTFFFFEELIDPEELSAIKKRTNDLESKYAAINDAGFRRRINIDPGYITEAKVVLGSTKDFAHRIYVGAGIYAEVTLKYDKETRLFVPLDHTYPEFREEKLRLAFTKGREMLRKQLERRAGFPI